MPNRFKILELKSNKPLQIELVSISEMFCVTISIIIT